MSVLAAFLVSPANIYTIVSCRCLWAFRVYLQPKKTRRKPVQWRRNEFESGGTGPEQKWGGGHRSGAKRRKKIWSCPSLFGSKSTISRFGERFRDGQYSLVSLLFAVLLTVPPVPSNLLKWWARATPPCSMELAPLSLS